MAENSATVLGVYSNRASAETAVSALQANRFQRDHISVLVPENIHANSASAEKRPQAPEEQTIGAKTGSFIGRAVGVLAAIVTLPITGLGLLLGAEAITSRSEDILLSLHNTTRTTSAKRVMKRTGAVSYFIDPTGGPHVHRTKRTTHSGRSRRSQIRKPSASRA